MAVSGSSRDRNRMASRGRALSSGKIMDLKSHCGPLLIFNSQVNDVDAHGQLLLRLWRVREKSLLQASFDLIVQNSKSSQKTPCPAVTGNNGVIISHSETKIALSGRCPLSVISSQEAS